jgi:hypothetical protein
MYKYIHAGKHLKTILLKPIMKKASLIAAITLSLIVCYSCSSQKKLTKQPDTYPWFSFKWYADSVSGRYYDKLAITLPVAINELKGNFITQFDLGSNSTDLYGNSIKNYYNSREELLTMIDTAKKTGKGDDMAYKSKNFVIKFGNQNITDIWFSDKFGSDIHKDSLYTNTDKLVGTVGANFTKNKVLIIDYPNKKMCVLDSIDGYWSKKATFIDCIVKKNRIHIPVTINGKTYRLLFDTGASIFPISTDYETWKEIADSTQGFDMLKANSWGEKVSFYGAPIKHDTYLGNQKLNKGMVYYNNNKRLLEFNKQEAISGTTGNIWFANDIVVIDFKNKKFGVVK